MLLYDDEKLNKGLRKYADMQESELRHKRDRTVIVNDLIERNERKLYRLTGELGEVEGSLYDAVKRASQEAGKILDELKKEFVSLKAEISQ
jgi:hypothetical protein